MIVGDDQNDVNDNDESCNNMKYQKQQHQKNAN